MRRWLNGLLISSIVLSHAGCGDLGDGSAPPTSPAVAPASGEALAYPLHWYGDETDLWPYITPDAPAYMTFVADDQTPHADDGPNKRTCPTDPWLRGNAHLRMHYGLETLDFDFRGPFSFIRHVSTTSPYPTAAYLFHRNAYTRDRKYYAPAGGQILLACDGYYVSDNAALRLWTGYLYGKNYTGDIVRNPDYEDPEDGGDDSCGGGAAPELDHQIAHDLYNPYDPGPGTSDGGCGGGEGGEGTQYSPGEFTGGQTVSWESGIGTGQPSACGDQAKVEYICIEVWDEAAGMWVEWSCGYATVC